MTALHNGGAPTSGPITSLTFSFEGSEGRITVYGRDAWALDQLMRAGAKGCTPIENPAPRWSHYVWKLRGEDIDIETVDEPHGGVYPGSHARYVLRSRLVNIRATYYGANARSAKSLSQSKRRDAA